MSRAVDDMVKNGPSKGIRWRSTPSLAVNTDISPMVEIGPDLFPPLDSGEPRIEGSPTGKSSDVNCATPKLAQSLLEDVDLCFFDDLLPDSPCKPQRESDMINEGMSETQDIARVGNDPIDISLEQVDEKLGGDDNSSQQNPPPSSSSCEPEFRIHANMTQSPVPASFRQRQKLAPPQFEDGADSSASATTDRMSCDNMTKMKRSISWGMNQLDRRRIKLNHQPAVSLNRYHNGEDIMPLAVLDHKSLDESARLCLECLCTVCEDRRKIIDFHPFTWCAIVQRIKALGTALGYLDGDAPGPEARLLRSKIGAIFCSLVNGSLGMRYMRQLWLKPNSLDGSHSHTDCSSFHCVENSTRSNKSKSGALAHAKRSITNETKLVREVLLNNRSHKKPNGTSSVVSVSRYKSILQGGIGEARAELDLRSNEVKTNREFEELFGLNSKALSDYMTAWRGGILPWHGDLLMFILTVKSKVLDYLKDVSYHLKNHLENSIHQSGPTPMESEIAFEHALMFNTVPDVTNPRKRLAVKFQFTCVLQLPYSRNLSNHRNSLSKPLMMPSRVLFKFAMPPHTSDFSV